MSAYQEFKSSLVIYAIGVLGSFLIVIGLIWAMYRYTRPEPITQDRSAERKKALTEMRMGETEALNLGFEYRKLHELSRRDAHISHIVQNVVPIGLDDDVHERGVLRHLHLVLREQRTAIIPEQMLIREVHIKLCLSLLCRYQSAGN